MTNSSKHMLRSSPNPYRNKIYTVSIIQEVTLNLQTFLMGLRYIPDKLLLDNMGLSEYLAYQKPDRSEVLVHDILEDVMDQVVPKWIEVNLLQKDTKSGQAILVTMEERQPGWTDDALLKRLPPIFRED